jgi:hypothetical protein
MLQPRDDLQSGSACLASVESEVCVSIATAIEYLMVSPLI